MTAELTVTRPIFCDGCAQEATPEHLRGRVARLEWTSRFRPVRMGTLFLTPAPPAEMEDYFYFPEGWPRDPQARALQEDLLDSCGIARNDADGRKASLPKFQEAGCFLAYCVECPMGISGGAEFDALLSRLMSTLLLRIRFSYRPKSIVMISERLSGLAQALRSAQTEPLPPVRGGRAVPLPKATDTAGRTRFRAELGALLSEAGGHCE